MSAMTSLDTWWLSQLLADGLAAFIALAWIRHYKRIAASGEGRAWWNHLHDVKAERNKLRAEQGAILRELEQLRDQAQRNGDKPW